jgi:hypothetical protein
VEGRLFEFAFDPHDDSWNVHLSSHGKRIAVTRTSAGPIYILTSHGQPLQVINVKGWRNLLGFSWAANGQGWYVSAGSGRGHVLLYVDLQGNAYPLWNNIEATGESDAKPSPDGRHLGDWKLDHQRQYVDDGKLLKGFPRVFSKLKLAHRTTPAKSV